CVSFFTAETTSTEVSNCETTNPRSSRRKRSELVMEQTDFDHKALYSSGVRKSLRARVAALKHKSYNMNGNKNATPKTRSRKHVLKKHPMKLCPAPPLIRLEQSVRYGDTRYNIGDIVSVVDIEGGTYYAQIRSLAVDALGDTCCVLTWLIPTTDLTSDTFQPENFVFGMEEDVLRDINCCSLVCRCPADYFRPLASPYSIQSY
ncbi:GATA zinc finger domain-containing protein 1, partial [Paragonimus kellicotti]